MDGIRVLFSGDSNLGGKVQFYWNCDKSNKTDTQQLGKTNSGAGVTWVDIKLIRLQFLDEA